MKIRWSRREFLTAAAAVTGAAGIYRMGSHFMKITTTDFILSRRPLEFPWETADPFLFCVHHLDLYPAAGNAGFGPDRNELQGRQIGQDFVIRDGWRMYHGERVPGFPGHPHRGFETVTFVRRGFVDHSDSHGAAGRYGGGDVQWMTAGSGLQHSEMFPLLQGNVPNTLELFQIWLNLPARRKMTNPAFKMLWSEDIPRPVVHDPQGRRIALEVAAGSLAGYTAPAPAPDSWAADPANRVGIWHLILEAGASFTLPEDLAEVNRTIYVYDGAGAELNGIKINAGLAVRVRPETEILLHNPGPSELKVLLLQGMPIGEPVVQYGPFVMNSRAEIEQAFHDYQRTGFGGWPWPTQEPVHGPLHTRFARHADGRVEERPIGT